MAVFIQGGSKGIGNALAQLYLKQTPYKVIVTSRTPVKEQERLKWYQMDIRDPGQIQSVSQQVEKDYGKELQAVLNVSGFLDPEKSVRQASFDTILEHFETNTIGPLLVAKHFSGLLAKPQNHPLWINLSARTGSIEDNKLGGWYSYRMSKAALNQLTRTLSHELGRKGVIVCSLHPGTVKTDLSSKFIGNAHTMSPEESAAKLFQVIQSLKPEDNGSFLDYQRKPIPW
ncbi:hypothetical protein EDD86DRAFT_210605 [Gorgonomyces haynaldii]|nr:hypothetical protein EDD86DRAFT_210605 [Gorgonomyces haynaldii]